MSRKEVYKVKKKKDFKKRYRKESLGRWKVSRSGESVGKKYTKNIKKKI